MFAIMNCSEDDLLQITAVYNSTTDESFPDPSPIIEYNQQAMSWKSNFANLLHEMPLDSIKIYNSFEMGILKNYWRQLNDQQMENLFLKSFDVMLYDFKLLRRLQQRSDVRRDPFMRLYKNSESIRILHVLRPICEQSNLLNRKSINQSGVTQVIMQSIIDRISPIKEWLDSIRNPTKTTSLSISKRQYQLPEIFAEFTDHLFSKSIMMSADDLHQIVLAFEMLMDIGLGAYEFCGARPIAVDKYEYLIERMVLITGNNLEQVKRVFDIIVDTLPDMPDMRSHFLKFRYKLISQSDVAVSSIEKQILELDSVVRNVKNEKSCASALNDTKDTFRSTLEVLNGNWNPQQISSYNHACLKGLADKLLQTSVFVDRKLGSKCALINSADLTNTLKHIIKCLERTDKADKNQFIKTLMSTYQTIGLQTSP